MYNPKTYWEKRGGVDYRFSIRTPEYSKHQMIENAFFEDVLKRFRPKSLLDFGCGAGEWIALWRNAKIEHLALYEISSTMLAEAKKIASQLFGYEWHPMDCPVRCDLASDDRLPLPYKDGEFDMVVACEVLAHILPTEIEGTLSELNRVLSKDGVLAIVTASPFGQGASHNFDYDYNALLLKGYNVESDAMLEPYRHIVAKRKNG